MFYSNNSTEMFYVTWLYILLLFTLFEPCGLYYKPMMIVNDDSRVINKLETSLTDDARVIIYNRHMFIVQATAFRKNMLI